MIDKFEIALKEFSDSNSGMYQDEKIFNHIQHNHYLGCFGRIPDKWKNGFVKKFILPNAQKLQTLAEIETISLFPEENIDIKKIGGKTPDFIIKLDREIIVDVYSAMHFLNSEKVGFDPGGPAKFVGNVTHHLEMALKDKFQKYSGYPLVVIINNIFSFIHFDQIPHLELSRYENHENLSAFVLYNLTQINGEVLFKFSVVPYENAKFPLSENEMKFIEKAFRK